MKAAEDSFDEAQAREIKSGYAALPPAPYEDLLPERGEIWVELYSDAGHTVDRGLYYQAKGTISVPITITRDQYISLNEGTQLELVSDGLTGETVILKKAAGHPVRGLCADRPEESRRGKRHLRQFLL